MRVQKIVKHIISEDQCGYVKNRFIWQNIRLINDFIDACTAINDNNVSILFVDFQKAVDSLDITFLESCLVKLGFGNTFIGWVKTITLC